MNLNSYHSDFLPLFTALRRQAVDHRHRYTIVLSGSQDWAVGLARSIITDLGVSDILWVGSEPSEGYAHRHPGCAHTVLGQEYDCVVLDTYEGFDADDFGALSGVVLAGGFMILLTPVFSEWIKKSDPAMEKMLVAGFSKEQAGHRFIHRLCRLLREDPGVVIFNERGEVKDIRVQIEQDAQRAEQATTHPLCATEDQANAVESILELFSSEDGAVVVLISDRGRGKSSALGIAAADLLKRNDFRIAITAPRLSAVHAVFDRAAQALPNGERQPGRLLLAKGSLEFYAPDELIRHPREADLLLVDEAAAIPGQLLSQLLDRYTKVAFATTVHGYEGSGRGFELRFSRVLDSKRTGWQRIRLSQPVRWAEHDPLEALSFRALLMGASPAQSELWQDLKLEDCHVEGVNRDLLVQDESVLRDLFGLLVTAHYRTRPFDLRYLLDAPNVRLYVLRWAGHIVATAMLAEEGGFDRSMAAAIYAGLRRPRGHLLAQSLSAHVGVESAPMHRFMRVVRIAVHPELQDRGLGTRLLKGVIEDLMGRGYAAIGTSFAADNQVLNFWHKNDFHVVHVGISQEHTTGSRSVMMLKPLNPEGQEIEAEARQRYAARFQMLLNDVLAGLDESLQDILLDGLPVERGRLDAKHELLAYAFARRGFEVCLYAIKPYIEDLFDQGVPEYLSEQQRTLLERRVLHHTDWKTVGKALDLDGKREAQELMRQTLAVIINYEGTDAMRAYRDVLVQLDRGIDTSS